MSIGRSCFGLLILGILVAAACSANESDGVFAGPTGSGSTPVTTTGTGTIPGGPGPITGNGGSTGLTIDVSSNTDGGVRKPVCEDPARPETCSCVNIASIGLVARYGANNDSTDAFMNWLDTKSTAGTVAKLTARNQVVLTADELAKYDIIVLQHMTDNGKAPAWVFTPEEVEAVRSWVMDKGGAIFAMTGYESSNFYEIAPTNQLLAFSGIQINSDDICGSGAAALADCQTLDICPQSGAIGCCSCWKGPQRVTGWDPNHEISKGITAEPIYRGRTISPGDAEVVATHRGVIVAAAKKVGNGRVFVFGDEWITYTSQWQDNTPVGAAAASNACYDATTKLFRTPSNVFQVGRLWYNAIRWLQPAMTCFTIQDIIL